MQIQDEIRTYVPFHPHKEEDERVSEGVSARGYGRTRGSGSGGGSGSVRVSERDSSAVVDTALQKVFEQRSLIFSLLHECTSDVLQPHPTPTYVNSLQPYLTLPYTHTDLLALNATVDGEMNPDFPLPRERVSELVREKDKQHTKQLLTLFHEYGIDSQSHTHSHTHSSEYSGEQEKENDEDSGDEGRSDSQRHSSTRAYLRNSTVVATSVATGVQKMSVEEFHQKITWERWSGNGSTLHSHSHTHSHSHSGVESESGVEHLLLPHSPTAGGINISMLFKPPAWHNRDTKKNSVSNGRDSSSLTSRFSSSSSSGGVGTGRSSQTHKVLSFDDFMRSIPMFHALSVKEFEFIEQNSTILSFEDQEFIISEGQQADTVYVVREGVVQCVKARSNPTMVRRGDIFGDSAVTGQASQATYISSGSSLLICIPPKIFNAILHSSESDLNISNTGVVLEDSILTNHIEKFLDVLYLFEEKGDEVDVDVEDKGSEDVGATNKAKRSRASTFKLSKQSGPSNRSKSNITEDTISEVSEQPSLSAARTGSPRSRSQSFQKVPRVSSLFMDDGGSDGTSEPPDEENASRDDSSTSCSSNKSEEDGEVNPTTKSVKLEKPMVQPVSVMLTSEYIYFDLKLYFFVLTLEFTLYLCTAPW